MHNSDPMSCPTSTKITSSDFYPQKTKTSASRISTSTPSATTASLSPKAATTSTLGLKSPKSRSSKISKESPSRRYRSIPQALRPNQGILFSAAKMVSFVFIGSNWQEANLLKLTCFKCKSQSLMISPPLRFWGLLRVMAKTMWSSFSPLCHPFIALPGWMILNFCSSTTRIKQTRSEKPPCQEDTNAWSTLVSQSLPKDRHPFYGPTEPT